MLIKTRYPNLRHGYELLNAGLWEQVVRVHVKTLYSHSAALHPVVTFFTVELLG